MEIRPYYEEYVAGAQRILGDMMDFAIVSLNLDTKDFETAFLISPTSKQFAAGNPGDSKGGSVRECHPHVFNLS